VAWLAAAHIDDGIVGMDLAGNEAEFSAKPFAGIFSEAKQAGLHLTIHAGEWAGADNVREAIEQVGAERIGHGVRIMDDENVVALARERGTAFEVCVTSNYQSGVVPALGNHPLPRMLQADLDVTLNTDDPSVSRIDLSHEYKLVHEDLGIPMNIIKRTILASARASFLPNDERDALYDQMEAGLGLKLWKDE